MKFNLNSLSMAAIVELCGKAGIQTVASLKKSKQELAAAWSPRVGPDRASQKGPKPVRKVWL